MFSARFEVSIWATNKALLVSVVFITIAIIFTILIKINLRNITILKKTQNNYLFHSQEFISLVLIFVGIIANIFC